MRTERFTTRTQEAILAAQQLAEGEGHPELMATHLLPAQQPAEVSV